MGSLLVGAFLLTELKLFSFLGRSVEANKYQCKCCFVS